MQCRGKMCWDVGGQRDRRTIGKKYRLSHFVMCTQFEVSHFWLCAKSSSSYLFALFMFFFISRSLKWILILRQQFSPVAHNPNRGPSSFHSNAIQAFCTGAAKLQTKTFYAFTRENIALYSNDSNNRIYTENRKNFTLKIISFHSLYFHIQI